MPKETDRITLQGVKEKFYLQIQEVSMVDTRAIYSANTA